MPFASARMPSIALTQLRSVLDLMEAELASRQGDDEGCRAHQAAAKARWEEAVGRWTSLHGEARFVVRRVERLLKEGLPTPIP